MNKDEYSLLFHKLELNRVAFKRLMDCDDEVLKLVNAAVEQEREACAKVCENIDEPLDTSAVGTACAAAIRLRGHK